MNTTHHQEQMEAVRRDFQKLWHGELLKRMQLLRVPINDFPKYEDIAWRAYLDAKQITKP